MVQGRAARQRTDSLRMRIAADAAKLAEVNGPEAVTVAAVAAAAGVGITTMYRYFHGQSSLLEALRNGTYARGSSEDVSTDAPAGARSSTATHPRSRRTRARIAVAIRDVVASTAVEDITVEQIARHAGVHPRTFYRYFTDLPAAIGDVNHSDNVGRIASAQLPGVRRRPQRPDGAKTLATINAAARQVCGEVGPERMTTTDVAERAGVSIGTFYRYYSNRISLLEALFPERDIAAGSTDLRVAVQHSWDAGYRAGWKAAQSEQTR